MSLYALTLIPLGIITFKVNSSLDMWSLWHSIKCNFDYHNTQVFQKKYFCIMVNVKMSGEIKDVSKLAQPLHDIESVIDCKIPIRHTISANLSPSPLCSSSIYPYLPPLPFNPSALSLYLPHPSISFTWSHPISPSFSLIFCPPCPYLPTVLL